MGLEEKGLQLRRSHDKHALIDILYFLVVNLSTLVDDHIFLNLFHNLTEFIFSMVGDVPVDKQRDAFDDFVNLQICQSNSVVCRCCVCMLAYLKSLVGFTQKRYSHKQYLKCFVQQ